MIKLRSAAARLRASPEFWYWLALTVVHFFLPLNVRGTDEAKFFSWAKTQSGIFRTVISNSSRILIDWLTYCSVRMPFVWRLVNPLVIIALEILLIRLLRLQSKRERLVLRTLNLFSFLMLSVIVSSMTCSLNYLWPFTALLFVWDTLLNQKEVQANRKMENRRGQKTRLRFWPFYWHAPCSKQPCLQSNSCLSICILREPIRKPTGCPFFIWALRLSQQLCWYTAAFLCPTQEQLLCPHLFQCSENSLSGKSWNSDFPLQGISSRPSNALICRLTSCPQSFPPQKLRFIF
jgi:hypothetical protein